MKAFLTALIIYYFLSTSSSREDGNANVSDPPSSTLLKPGSSTTGNNKSVRVYRSTGDVSPSGGLSVALENNQTGSRSGVAEMATILDNLHWPKDNVTGKPTVTYLVDGDDNLKAMVLEAISEFTEHTCIDFRLADTVRDTSYIIFKQHATICGTVFGRKLVPTILEVSPACTNKPFLIQVLARSIGLYSVERRSDRDDFVFVNYQNVIEDFKITLEKAAQHTKVLTSNEESAYDYTSIVHANGLQYSKNGSLTIITKDVKYQGLLGRSTQLSHMDKRVINLVYKCTANWMKICGHNEDPCKNLGYIGSSCFCVCPPGTSGERCQNNVTDYYESSLPACSRTILKETFIISSLNITSDTWCVLTIKPPDDHVVKLTFLRFFLNKTAKTCSDAFLEIRYQQKFIGSMFCGNDIKPGQSFISTRNDSMMDLYLDVRNEGSRGFDAAVTFIYIGNATNSSNKTAAGTTCICFIHFVIGYLISMKIMALF